MRHGARSFFKGKTKWSEEPIMMKLWQVKGAEQKEVEQRQTIRRISRMCVPWLAEKRVKIRIND